MMANVILENFLWFFGMILNVFLSIKICRALDYFLMLYKQNSKNEKIYIYSFNLKSDMIKACYSMECIPLFFWIVFFLIGKISDIIFLVVLGSTIIHHIMTRPNENHILEVNNLNIGYGAAIAYYKNYLEMTLTERFKERVENFKSYNMIQNEIPRKLFILVPESCKVPHYLETIKPEIVERCQELNKEEISHGGVKNRQYNITVYNINGLRMAVEYAQPLKAFFLFKQKGLFTEEEMVSQRKLFAETLKNFQKEDLNKYFEIVEYDDFVSEVSEVLSNRYYDSHSEIV